MLSVKSISITFSFNGLETGFCGPRNIFFDFGFDLWYELNYPAACPRGKELPCPKPRGIQSEGKTTTPNRDKLRGIDPRGKEIIFARRNAWQRKNR
jgi:hypothetical protein